MRDDLIAEYDLPPLPEEDAGDRDLILFRIWDSAKVIAERVNLEDARAYCSREDTHGDGWFIGFDQRQEDS